MNKPKSARELAGKRVASQFGITAKTAVLGITAGVIV
jgi:hypothetical protein